MSGGRGRRALYGEAMTNAVPVRLTQQQAADLQDIARHSGQHVSTLMREAVDMLIAREEQRPVRALSSEWEEGTR